jgi:hypothetical protein
VLSLGDVALDPSLVKTNGLKLAFNVAAHIYNDDFGLTGLRILDYGRDRVSFQNALNEDSVLRLIEQLI